MTNFLFICLFLTILTIYNTYGNYMVKNLHNGLNSRGTKLSSEAYSKHSQASKKGAFTIKLKVKGHYIG